MADSMWVLLNKARLPTVEQFAELVEASDFPLSIDRNWDWASHSGWLPMSWDGDESGCEVDTEALEPDDIEAAASAGHAGLDTVVVLTPRGWDSLKVANAFAACLVEHCGGVISEDEDEYLAGEEASTWARRAVEDAAQSERREVEREAARENALADSDPETLLTAMLAEMSGKEVTKFHLIGDSLSTHTDGGVFVSGSCWRLHHDGLTYDVTRFRLLKEKQDKLMETEENWGEAMEAMEPELEEADRLDVADKEPALSILEGLVGETRVAEVRWNAPHTMEVELTGDAGTVIEYLNQGYLHSINVESSELRFYIARDIRVF